MSSRVLLVSPPTWGLPLPMTNPFPTPPLGLAVVSKYLKKNGHEVRILDTAVLYTDLLGFARIIRDYNPDIIGFTTYFQNPAIIEMVKVARENSVNSLVILGGLIASSFGREILDLNNELIDVVISGSGIEHILKLADLKGSTRVERKKEITKLKEFEPVGDGYISVSQENELVYDGNLLLGNLSPALYRRIHYVFSVGCPFHCLFCVCGGKQADYSLDMESIAKEIGLINSVYGHNVFTFLDETLTFPHSRIMEFEELLAKHVYDPLYFWGGTRIDCLNEKTIKVLKNIGVTRVFLGIESTKPESQKYIGKKSCDLEDIRRKVEMLHNAGIKAESSLLLGLPYETIDDFFHSIEDVVEIGFDKVMFTIVCVIPGTEFAIHPQKYGYEELGKPESLIQLFNQDLFKVNGKGFYKSVMFSTEQCEKAIKDALNLLDYDNFDSKPTAYTNKYLFRNPF